MRDPLEDWTREDTGLVSTFSLQAGADRMRQGPELIEVVHAALAAEVAGALITVSTRKARPSF